MPQLYFHFYKSINANNGDVNCRSSWRYFSNNTAGVPRLRRVGMCADSGAQYPKARDGKKKQLPHLAEVDGNRTRQTRFTRLNRFEGGGAHQAHRHLHKKRVSGIATE